MQTTLRDTEGAAHCHSGILQKISKGTMGRVPSEFVLCRKMRLTAGDTDFEGMDMDNSVWLSWHGLSVLHTDQDACPRTCGEKIIAKGRGCNQTKQPISM